MWLGQDIHSRRAELRAAEDTNYRAEVHVVHRTTRRNWNITITGRIDGLSIDRDERRVSVEEVKSIHFDLELEALYRSEKLQRHLYQLLLYSLFLSTQPELAGFAFAPQLGLIDLVSGESKVVDAEFEAESVAATLEASLDQLLDDVESRHGLLAAKRAFAESLAFPYERMRPFQQEIVDAVERAVRQREALLVSAPTGIGKTMAALYPALRESLKAGKKLFYLTSKTLQQEMAVEALRLLNDGSFRVLRIRAKQKMCAHTEMICHEDFCPFAARYSEKMEKSGLLSRMATSMSYFDPDLTFELAKSTEVCPFEVSLELIEQADVIVCDYNYIFDPYVGLKAYQQESDYGDCVLIVDEAHNLVDRGRGYYSPELHESAFDAIRKHLIGRNCWIDGWEELLELLRDHLRQLAEASEEGSTQTLCEPDRELFVDQRAEWERAATNYISWKIENRIAEEVAEIAVASDGNFLALFPSYAFLREVADRMPPIGKNVMLQRADMTDYERNAMLDILRHKPSRGNLILAVSGGMYAEGVDYRGDMLSGVMVVGPALPTVSFEQELLKRYYDDQYGCGFEFAYLIPGMTRVVQSAGRVIRSETDVGIIALLCKRFAQETYARYFPADWYDESPRELVSRKPAAEIRAFFEAKTTA